MDLNTVYKTEDMKLRNFGYWSDTMYSYPLRSPYNSGVDSIGYGKVGIKYATKVMTDLQFIKIKAII